MTHPMTENNSSPADLLLITKVHTPRLQSDLVTRTHLYQRLGNVTSKKLTLITAPAGFGKSTLAQTWLKHEHRAFGWISLDIGDNEPKRFWSYVIAAIRTQHESFGENIRQVLRHPTSNLQVAVTMLINEIATLQQPLTLVFDDYHVIETQAIHDTLNFLIEHLPTTLHLVILSRTEPPLSLPRLRARRQINEITASDLRFNTGEVATFFNNLIDLNLTESDVAKLEARTEGWIAGLQMAALSMQGQDDVSGFVEAFTGGHHHILDYLLTEVFEQQTQDIQKFLLRTSILHTLSADICDAITDNSTGQTTLELLSQRNLFVVAMDTERECYRYHKLFAEFLYNRLQQTQPDWLSESHHRAALWFIEQGFYEEAVEQHLAGEQFEAAADLIEEHGQQIFWRFHEWTRFQRWLDTLPDTLVKNRPRLCAIYCWGFLLTGESDKIELYVNMAERAIIADSDPDIRGELKALRAEQALLQGQLDTALALAKEALQLITDENIIIRTLTVQIKGYIYRSQGKVELASQNLTEAYRLAQQSGDLLVGIFALSDLGDVKVMEGKLREALEIYNRIVDSLNPMMPSSSTSFQGIGNIYREYNRLNEAEEEIRQGIEVASQNNAPALFRAGYISLAYVLRAKGQYDDALQAVDKANQSAHKQPIERIQHYVRVHEMNIRLLNGNMSHAELWAKDRDLHPDIPVTYPREFELVVYARYLLESNRCQEAVDLLLKITHAAEVGKRTGNLIEDLVILSTAYAKLGNESAALKSIERAVQLGQIEGHIRTFLDGGKTIVRLLRLLVAHSPHTRYISRILTAFGLSNGSSTVADNDLYEDLSERELEVLRLLAVGMSNKEIAQQLFIGNSTVKTHTLNIYRKLDVNNRTQAVNRARELNML